MELNLQESLKIDIDNYSGPLEVLLDLAKSQKVDMSDISVTQLADEFIKFINKEKNINLDIASEYLVMASWLTYLKSKLLLPQEDEENFKATEVAEQLKIQLKKLELIRLLSDQLMKKNRLGVSVYMRGMKEGIKSVKNSKYTITLYELLKSYSNHIMKKNFILMSIPKLPVCTTEEAILIIRKNIKNLNDWTKFSKVIPVKFKKNKKIKKSAVAGFFSASLELSKEGLLSIMQKKDFGTLMIREKK